MDTSTTPSLSTSEPPAPTLTRRIRFRAPGWYEGPQGDDTRNHRAFGERRRSPEHRRVVDTTVSGSLDPETGGSVGLGALESARWFWAVLCERLESGIHLVAVRVAEAEELWSGCRRGSTR
jgi:hypothetical protein